MITELFIEGKRIDISADISSLLTFAIDDVRDFASRQTAFSKTIVLPGTGNNNKIFGHIFETGISNNYDPAASNIGSNFNASKSAACLMFQDNMQTFKGTLRLLEIINDQGNIEYEAALNGELTSLSTALSSGYLTDLDFSSYDQAYSIPNISASWDNPGGSGVYFPLIDYGNYSPNKHDWDLKTFRPALYVKEYIDKIFAKAGFRYNSSFFNTDRFKGLIIPHNRKILTRKNRKVMEASITSTHFNPDLFAWDTISSLIFGLTTGNKHIEYTAAAGVSGTVQVQVSGNFRHGDITVQFYKNGIPLLGRTIVWDGFNNPQFFSFTESVAASFGPGDYISCIIQLNNVTTGYEKNITKNTVQFISDLPQDAQVEFSDVITINDTLPVNVRQIDFLTSIVKLFNLYVYESKFDERLILISPYVDFYSTSSSNADNWSYKLNRSEPVRIKPMSELNSKIYKFNYKDDTDFWNALYKKRYNEAYGSHVYDTQFEFTSQVNQLDLIFAPTPLVGYGGEDKVYSTILKITNGLEEQIDSVIRILQTKKITGVSSWKIQSQTLTYATLTDYGYAGHFDNPDNVSNDLNFGVIKELFFVLLTGDLTKTQFNLYWSSYMAEITDKDSKIISGKFYLTPKDIFELDFSKYKVVDGVLFRLNKIEDYNATTPSDCKVELLRVINTIY